MNAALKSPAGKRVLVVEDELMIRMLLQDMLADLGHTLAGEAGRIEEALALAKEAAFDVAILDVNLNGQPISPVVEILIDRGLPFVFATGYGQRGVPEAVSQHADPAEAVPGGRARRSDRGGGAPRPRLTALYSNSSASFVI